MAEDTILVNCLHNYRHESDQARLNRLEKNKLNFDMYHLNQDYSHKNKGQSTETLPKQMMAVEQIANFVQQGLMDIGKWYEVSPQVGMTEQSMAIKPSEITHILDRQLLGAKVYKTIGNGIKLAALGSLLIVKVHGGYVTKPKYIVDKKMGSGGKVTHKLLKVDDLTWQLKWDLVRHEDFYPDPTGNNLYVLHDTWMDYYELEKLAKGDNAIYDIKEVEKCKGSSMGEAYDHKANISRETGQNTHDSNYRKRVKVTELWGNILDNEGKLLHENCVCTFANDTYVIRKPTRNPFWHQQVPFVVVPLIDVPFSVWGKALMDAPTALNRAINELFNLIVDGGMMSVHGIKQLHDAWLADPEQVQDGISAGDTLRVNSACIPGAKVLERVDTSAVPQDGLAVLNVIQQEFNTASITNDLRMGVASFRAVKATEVVEANQSITSMFKGMANNIEIDCLVPLLDLSWKTVAQHINEIDKTWMEATIGKVRTEAIQNMSAEEVFAETVSGCVYSVGGLSQVLGKQKDFTKLTALLQTVASAPMLLEEFAKKYDFGKFLEEIIKTLDINVDKLKLSPDELAQAQSPSPMPMQNDQGNIPQAGAVGNQGDLLAPTANNMGREQGMA